MIKPVHFEDGDYGLKAVLTSPWSESVGAEIKSRKCAEIEFNDAKGWKGNDLSFLSEFPNLKALKIIDFTIASVEPIHLLKELQALEIMTYCLTPIRFSSFPMLEDCGLEWRSGAESLFEQVKLRKLFVNSYKGKGAEAFGRLVNLENLAILNAPIENLNFLETLGKLRVLRLANLKKIHSLKGIERLVNLEELEIHTCRSIGSIDEIGSLPVLKKLYLNNDGDIASFKPLKRLENLEAVIFYESTNVVDGDLSHLALQKNLSRVSFQNRRHYSHKREDFGAAYNNCNQPL
jgi:hypothetical protein